MSVSSCSLSSVCVLKFGSSVLRSPADLATVVHDVYARWRSNGRVIAVVSAFAGVTDHLFAEGRRCGAREHALAELVAAGERESAQALRLALRAAGIPARVAGPREIGLRAEGAALEASPMGLDVPGLRRRLEHTPILVVPGFIAVDETDRTVLLGRGGSDLTALFLAQRLGATCRLVKDVDGVYDRDPARAGPAHRYAQLGWQRALEVGGELVQPRAIRFARLHGVAFEVGAAGGDSGTHVGSASEQFAVASGGSEAPLDVVLLGLGTVGYGVYRYLAARPDLFSIRRIVVRDTQRPRESSFAPGVLSGNPWDAVNEPADLVIEALGGIEPAREVIHAALLRQRAVITANKAAVAAGWRQLARFASGPEPQLRFSAAVGGAVPVLETIASLGHHVTRVRGVLNGTCNFILDALERGAAFDTALAEAQAQGFAEADPSFDLDGRDAAHKLRLIALTAFGAGTEIDLDVAGIDQVSAARIAAAQATRRRLRLIAECERSGERVRGHVRLVELPANEFLARARKEENRVEIHTDSGRSVRLTGRGAGRWPTATSILGDVYAYLRARRDACARETQALRQPAQSQSPSQQSA